MRKVTLGEKIKRARMEKGMTQQEVVGDFITRNMLSKVENDVAKPSIKTVEYLAEKLNKPVSYFLEDLVSTSIDTKSNAELVFEHSAYMLKNKEVDKCISYLEDILENPTFSSYNIHYGRVLYNMGLCYKHKSDYEKAREYLEGSIDILKNTNDHYYLAKSYSALGGIYLNEDDLKMAEKFLNKGVNQLNKSFVHDIITEVKLNYDLSLCLYTQHKYPEALKTILYSLEISKENNYYSYKGYFHILAAGIYDSLNNVSKAIDHGKKAVSIFDAFEILCKKAEAQYNLGKHYVKKGLYSEAHSNLKDSLSYYKTNDEFQKVVSIELDIFKVLVKKNEYTRALEFCGGINKNLLNDSQLAKLYYLLGTCYISLDNSEFSYSYLTKAEKFALRENAFELLSSIYNALAELSSKKEDYKNAYAYSNKSSECWQKALDGKDI